MTTTVGALYVSRQELAEALCVVGLPTPVGSKPCGACQAQAGLLFSVILKTRATMGRSGSSLASSEPGPVQGGADG